MSDELVNIALDKPAQQSSCPSPDLGVSARAVDGEPRTAAAFETARERNPWWQVDLGATFLVEKIVVYNVGGPDRSRAASFAVSVSSDGSSWTNIYAALNRFGGCEDNNPLVLNLEGMTAARFVRCQVRGRGTLHLSQVEVLVKRELLRQAEALEAARIDTDAFFQGVLQRYSEVVFKPPARSRIDALEVTRFGRFGNCVVCLTNAIAVAQAIGVQRVFFNTEALDGELDLTIRPEASTFQILPHTDPLIHQSCLLSASFFRLDAFPGVRDSLSHRERRALAQRFLVPLLNRQLTDQAPLDEDVTVVHFRSGDIFRGHPAPSYPQPPLSFYQTAIQHMMNQGCSRVVLVYEDYLNPVIAPLEQWCRNRALETSISMSSFMQDLRVLLAARHLIASRSTLMEALLLIASHLRSVAIFEEPVLAARAAECGVDVYHFRDEAREYTPVGSWNDTAEQRELMLTYPANRLRLEEVP